MHSENNWLTFRLGTLALSISLLAGCGLELSTGEPDNTTNTGGDAVEVDNSNQQDTPADSSQPDTSPEPAPSPETDPEPTPSPDTTPEPQPDPLPDPTPEPEPDPLPDPTPQPEPDPLPDPTPQPEPDPLPNPTPQPEPDPLPDPTPQPEPDPLPDPTPEPEPDPLPEPGPGQADEPAVYSAVTAEYEFEGINTTNALHLDSDHFRIYYGGNGKTGPNGTMGENSQQTVQEALDFLEGAFDYFVHERGFHSPGAPVGQSDLTGYYKINVYSQTDLNANGLTEMDAISGLPYIIMNSARLEYEAIYVHEFGHTLTMAEYNWAGHGEDNVWWEGIAQWIADTYLASEQHASVAQRYNLPTDYSVIRPDRTIVDSNLSIIHMLNRYSNWPFFTYLSNNPDNFSGLGEQAMLDLIHQHRNNETMIHALSRMVSPVSAQKVMAYYNAHLAYLDLGRDAIQTEFMSIINTTDFRNSAYKNLYFTNNGTYRVLTERQPMYGGSNIIPLTVTSNGQVDIKVTNLGNGFSESDFTAIAAIYSKTTGKTRYKLCENGSATLNIANDEEASLVVTNTPTNLYIYDEFESQPGDPEVTGLNYEVQFTGAMPRDL